MDRRHSLLSFLSDFELKVFGAPLSDLWMTDVLSGALTIEYNDELKHNARSTHSADSDVYRWSGCVYQLLQEDLPIAGKVTVASNAKRKKAKNAFKAVCTRLRCVSNACFLLQLYCLCLRHCNFEA